MKPRIVFLIPGLSVGGAERHTLDLRVRLQALGYQTGLIVHGWRRADVLLAHPGAEGAVILDLKGMSNRNGWVSVRRELKRQDPDLIVAVNQTPLIVAIVTRLLGGTRAKVACVFHTTILRPGDERMFFLFRYALRLTDALVFVSSNQKDYWTERGVKSRASTVIRNGVDFSRFQFDQDQRDKTRADLGFTPDDYVLGIVAALRAEKAHLDFVQALSDVRARGIDAKGLLVGDGPTGPAIREAAAALGLTDHIVFAGEQADVRPYMCACDAGVLCSKAVETFSLSALEFLATGVPMVMSRLGGASEIVQHGVNGLLFDTGNVPQMADCLETLANKATRQRMASAARESIKPLTFEAMVQNYVDLFMRLCGKNTGQARNVTISSPER